MPILWGRKNSINVQKPLWAAAECGVTLERKNVGGPFGGLDTEEYGRLNPNRLIPVLQDGSVVLWESNAIVRYLAEKFGSDSGFYPHDIVARARANQWLDWVNSTFYVDLVPMFLQLYRVAEDKRDKKLIKDNTARLNDEKLPLADAYLGDGPFVAGKQITFGDMGLGTLLYRYFEMPISKGDFNNLYAYYQRLQESPHFKTHCMLPLG